MTSQDDYDSDAAEDDGVLDPSDSLGDDLGGDAVDRAMDAPDRWSAGERYGTTLAEERAGESLNQQLAAEEPDPDPDAGQWDADAEDGVDPEAGALLADDDGAGPDDEAELLGRDLGGDRGQASAEESAVHVIDPEGRR